MSGAVGIPETGDRRGSDLDLAARRRQWRGAWVPAEGAEDAAVARQGRQYQLAVFPELLEVRCIDAALRQRAAGRLVDLFEPLPRRAALRESFGNPEPLGQPGEDRVVVARLAVGGDCLVHRHQ